MKDKVFDSMRGSDDFKELFNRLKDNKIYLILFYCLKRRIQSCNKIVYIFYSD